MANEKMINDKSREFLILAIDTSCDETAAAITQGERVLSNIIYSQIHLHRKWGGVVPSLARWAHREKLGPVIGKALREAHKDLSEIEAVAVTVGPGLAIALEVGIAEAKTIARGHKKPLVAVDHMEGHLLSPFARDTEGRFGLPKANYPSLAAPALGLLVSGGHTELVLMEGFGKYRIIGQTLDDAAGECFDKVARILGLEYPGGPAISRLARKGNPAAFDLPVPMKDSPDFNFSFSGLKTACLYGKQKLGDLDQQALADFCAAFEKTVIEALLIKLVLACREFKPKMVLLGGGVVANRVLRARVREEMKRLGIPIHLPYTLKLLTDNAAMIGVAAFYKLKQGKTVKDIEAVERIPNLTLETPPSF